MSNSGIKRFGVITGATGGIGMEIARRLLRDGFTLLLTGRNFDLLLQDEEFQLLHQKSPDSFISADLSVDTDIDKLEKSLDAVEKIDLLVHCAACYHANSFKTLDVRELDRSYRVNVRAPFRLSQLLLPKLKKGNGTVIFLNSSVVHQSGKKGLTAYQSTKAALKGVADSLRAEVNADGVRVISAYLGKTATPMQQEACRAAGMEYEPGRMIQPESAAKIICENALAPDDLEVTDLNIRPAVSYG